MAIRKIVTIGDETLRKHCKPQEKFDKRLSTLLKDMAETMYKAEGVGLAAPQVGILRRIAVVDITEDHSGLLELVNATILFALEFEEFKQDISVRCNPMMSGSRQMTIEDYMDQNGDYYELETEGFEARAICHELDHLDGTLYIDVMDRELTEEEMKGHIPEDDQQ